jgi:hypothetical protein
METYAATTQSKDCLLFLLKNSAIVLEYGYPNPERMN